MKISTFLFVMASFFLLTSSCKSLNKVSEGGTGSVLDTLSGKNGISYNQSFAKWKKLKAQHNNSYSYTISFTSWTGYKNSTVIRVKKGKIVYRTFNESYQNAVEGGNETEEMSYTESGNGVGTHKEGWPAVTMDQMYADCSGKYLIVDPVSNELFFETSPDGLLTTCGYRDYMCADDCFEGISISAFKWSN
jgi:hypothetical protein